MTYTVISDGDDGLATPVMNNFIHVGRLSFSSFYPMNTSGVYAVQDLGEVGKEWGNAYFASGKKIYIGGIEFKGGGGGLSIEQLEMKAHLEKSGIVYPLSFTDGINESFIDTANVVITPRVSYASGTTLVADYNKTDLDLMNATTGWADGAGAGGAATVAQNTTQKIEGSGSVQFSRASQNGVIQMVKTFAAFSLVDQLLSFSAYVDTVSNLTRLFVIIESSAGNTKTYYIPVANISAATWAHISIDVNNDVADASAGTLVPGSITKIYFGSTTSSAQTVVTSIDFIVTQPNWIMQLPNSLYIWDGTNQERLAVASVAGTANHQRRTYTITALSNTYAVGAAYAKERNVTIANNQGILPTGLAGAVALTCYDQTTEHLPTSLTGKILTMSQRFWDEEFKVSTLSSTTVTKVSSASDKSGYFKTGDKVIIYHKRYNGRKYNSLYNATFLANFKILTLTSDATYASSEITLTHTGDVNSGASTDYYYIVRYSAEMLYALEAETAGGALTTLTPTIFKPQTNNNRISSDNFDRAALGSDYTPYPRGGSCAINITSNKFYWYDASAAAAQYSSCGLNIPTNYNPNAELEFTFDFIGGPQNAVAYAGPCFVCKKATNAVNDSSGVGVLLMGNSAWPAADPGGTKDLAVVDTNTVIVSSTNSLATEGATNKVKIQFLANRIRAKVWSTSASEPISWGVDTVFNSGYVATGATYCFKFLANNTGAVGCRFAIDNLVITDILTGYIVRGSVDNLTGSKLTTATKLTRRDSTNQNPIIYQRSAILS